VAQGKFTQIELANPAISGSTAVFGLDGLSNLVKYALGLDPKTNITTGLPAVTVVGSEWVSPMCGPRASPISPTRGSLP